MNDIIAFALWNDAVRLDENLPHFEDWEPIDTPLETIDEYYEDINGWEGIY